MNFPIENPREVARQLIRESVDPETWRQNEAFTRTLDGGLAI